MEHMIRKSTLDEIAEEAKEEAVIDYKGTYVDELIGVAKQANQLMIWEGETSKPMTYRAANLLSVGLHSPKWLASQFDDRVPMFFGEYWDKESDTPMLTPERDFGQYQRTIRIRPRELLDFWAKIIADVEKDDVADDHYKRYYSRLYLSLIQGNHNKLWVGVIPWAEDMSSDGIVFRGLPSWIHPEDPSIEEKNVETNSAADW